MAQAAWWQPRLLAWGAWVPVGACALKVLNLSITLHAVFPGIGSSVPGVWAGTVALIDSSLLQGEFTVPAFTPGS